MVGNNEINNLDKKEENNVQRKPETVFYNTINRKVRMDHRKEGRKVEVPIVV